MKERGILLPIFSLPSKYGIGDFGYEAYEFIDILSRSGIEYWEILPINACNRLPYSPLSYYALEEDYISLDKLKEKGFINSDVESEISEERRNASRAIYDDFKVKYFKEAYQNFLDKGAENCANCKAEYERFIQQKEIQEYVDYVSEKTGENRDYYLFLQFVLYSQWNELKTYANNKNVRIIGDMPVYPVFDSAETKFHPEYYEIENGEFIFEAGTPPDYYNQDGQKWNSPVYNVERMKKDGFEYLVKRFKYQLKLFDKVRVDYFRGYDSFFRIPIGKSGKEGEYVDGVGYAFFDKLFEDGEVNKDSLIIEDLGDIREETIKMREHYGFTRQKILEFSIDFYNFVDTDNEQENVVVFPGNHDCQTIYGWYKTLGEDNQWRLKEFLRRNGCNDINVNIGMIEYCMKCKAKIAIVMLQDIIGLDDSARINFPGTSSENNWSWKLVSFKEFGDEPFIHF